MTTILQGAKVAEVLDREIMAEVDSLRERGVIPTLAIIGVGERSDDISYERGATKRAEALGVAVQNIILPSDVTEELLLAKIADLNDSVCVHGVLLFRPLPDHLDEDRVRNALLPAKDVDGITDLSLAGVLTGGDTGFAPCTPSACLALLDHFGYDLDGRSVVVVGRSLVVGKPVALMLLARNATVTLAHSRTVQLQRVVSAADIVIVCVGRAELIDSDYLREGQIVIDVGINVTRKGRLVGDVDFEDVEELVAALTPVPGGVGALTTTILMQHVVQAAQRLC